MALSPSLVFPFREEEIPLYEWVISQRPDDWKPRYYLGLILWSKGRVDEARALFAQCDARRLRALLPVPGHAAADRQPGRGPADYEKAVRIDEKTWRNWHALIEFRTKSGQPKEALVAARQAAGIFPTEVPIQVDLVRSLMAVDKYGEAAAVLDTLDALPFEGASEIHALFARTHLQLGLSAIGTKDWAGAVKSLEHSKEYPGKARHRQALRSGLPDPGLSPRPDLRPARATRPNPRPRSRPSWITRPSIPEAAGPGAWFGAQALKRAGQAAQAAEILKSAASPGQGPPGRPRRLWARRP